MDKICIKCKYFEKTGEGEPGECRHYPPDTHVVDGELVTVFPQVLADEWCGEWTEQAEEGTE